MRARAFSKEQLVSRLPHATTLQADPMHAVASLLLMMNAARLRPLAPGLRQPHPYRLSTSAVESIRSQRSKVSLMGDAEDRVTEDRTWDSNLVLPPALRDVEWVGHKQPKSVWVVGDIDATMASDFSRQFSQVANSGQEVVPIFINSGGGDVYDLCNMIDVIRTSPVPVATIVVGRAFSSGAVLMTMGWDGLRYISPTSSVMLHSSSVELGYAKTNDYMAEAEELQRIDDMLNGLMDTNCGKAKDYFTNLTANMKRPGADVYLSAEEALYHGLANHIGLPRFETKISVSSRLVTPDSVKPSGGDADNDGNND